MTQSQSSSKPYLLDDQVGYLLRLASQRHAALFQAHIPENITPTQFSALMRLSEHKKCSQNQLGRLAGMDVATIKGVVDRLRLKGLALIEADPNDKRRSLITLTPQGVTLIQRLEKIGHEITAQTLEPLTQPEQRALLKALRKIT